MQDEQYFLVLLKKRRKFRVLFSIQNKNSYDTRAFFGKYLYSPGGTASSIPVTSLSSSALFSFWFGLGNANEMQPC